MRAIALVASVAALAAPAQASARVAIYGPGEAYPPRAAYEPTKWYPDNRTVAHGLHWAVWNGPKAIGTGITTTCAPGKVDCTTVRQKIIYSRPREICGVLTFTRFSYSQWSTTGFLEQIGSNPPLCQWYSS